MKKTPNCHWWLIATLLFALSCKSGEKLYNKGRYDEAVILFVKKLRKQPNDATALALLPKAYAQSVELHEKNAAAILATNNKLKFEPALREYDVLQNLYNNITACPAALTVVQPKDYRGQINASLDTAAATRYNHGRNLLRNNDILSARQAYSEFNAALSLIADYKDAKAYRDQAYQMGLVTMQVRNVALISQADQRSLEPLAAMYRDNLLNALRQKNNNNFLQILSEEEVVKNKLHPDYVVDIRVEDFMVSQPAVQRNTKQLQKVVEIQEMPDTVSKRIKIRKETYKGTLYFNTVSVATAGNIVCYLINTANDSDMEHLVSPADAGWSNSWTYFKGDEKVLAPEDRKLIVGEDLPSPTVGDLFNAALSRAFNGITTVVTKHYGEM